jgi:chromosome segregation protein
VRLSSIKLSGFKSFVDPTNFQVPGQLVGVVGPNGCGKSNIIDAVRWVLGESKASELRGESMQDVIFNGSTYRKPAGRASVELVFDNSDGKAAGQWGQYAEIAVKRTLTRDGTSTYYINGQPVRRRDIQDIFLGTGLGPRAYAIIGQGMIARIIESRPEELRVFLEEAAGVSKYKERRRETENRLSDTRENLTRVEDILRELNANLEKLEAQAAVAHRFHQLQSDQEEKQKLLWLLRKNEAKSEQARWFLEMEQAQTGLEEQNAKMRHHELELERMRQAHYATGDRLHAAQGELYQTNAEIGSLEARIKFVVESRTRLQNQIGTLTAQREQWLNQARETQEQIEEAEFRLEELAARVEGAQIAVEAQNERLPELDAAWRASQEKSTESRARIMQIQQRIELSSAHQRNASNILATLATRRERLQQERGNLNLPDAGHLDNLRMQLEEKQLQLEEQNLILEEAASRQESSEQERARPTPRSSRRRRQCEAGSAPVGAAPAAGPGADPGQGPALAAEARTRQAAAPVAEARYRNRLGDRAGVHPARAHRRARDLEPRLGARLLWRCPAGPHGAVHAVGRHRAAGSARSEALRQPAQTERPGFARFAGRLAARGLRGRRSGRRWPSASACRGGCFVTPHGHIVSRSTACASTPPTPSRTACWRASTRSTTSRKQLRAQVLLLDEARARATRADAAVSDLQRRLQDGRQKVATLQRETHALQIDVVKQAEVEARFNQRSGQISADLDEIAAQESEQRQAKMEAEAQFEELDMELAELQGTHEDRQTAFLDKERVLNEARDKLRELERSAQEAVFAEKTQRSRIDELRRTIATANQQAAQVLESIAAGKVELEALESGAAAEGLQELLARRTAQEQALADARHELDQLTQQLRAAEESRMAAERSLQPQRERITEMQLKEQAARLNQEQFTEALNATGTDEAELAQKLQPDMKPQYLQGEVTRLTNAITALGAVNLAAVEELALAAESEALPRFAECRPAGSDRHAGRRDLAHRPRIARPVAGHLRPRQRELFRAVPYPVRRRHRQTRDDRRGDPGCRRAGHGPAARQEERHHPPAVRRRKGPDRNGPGVLDVPFESGAVLPPRRGGRAPGRCQYRALLPHGQAHVRPYPIPLHLAQQDRDGDGQPTDRCDDAGAGRIAHRGGGHGVRREFRY